MYADINKLSSRLTTLIKTVQTAVIEDKELHLENTLNHTIDTTIISQFYIILMKLISLGLLRSKMQKTVDFILQETRNEM